MQTDPQEPAETYHNLSEEDLADIYADIASLTPEARAALSAEIQNRGLSEEQLQKLHAAELRHEAQFDRLETFRRKNLAWGRLPKDPKEWIITILGAFALILISELFSHHH